MTSYVSGLLFSTDRRFVTLLFKLKPAWMAGKLCPVGGKIEPGETPLEAMQREFCEEAGLDGIDWQPTAHLRRPLATVHVFHAFDDRIGQVRTADKEPVALFRVSDLDADRLISDLPILISLALDTSGITRPVTLFNPTAAAA